MDNNSVKYRRLSLILIVVCLLLLGAIMQLLNGNESVRATTSGKSTSTDASALPSVPVVEDGSSLAGGYEEFVKRPLFTQNRKPPKAIVKKAGGKKTPTEMDLLKPTWELIGTLVTPEVRHAMFFDPKQQAVIRVQKGAMMEGWKVEEIRNKQVEISKEEHRHSYSLPEFNQDYQ